MFEADRSSAVRRRVFAAIAVIGGACSSDNDSAGPRDASIPDAPHVAAVTVTVHERAGFPSPAWLAVQDGSGPFQRLMGESPYTLAVNDVAGRFGLAVGCDDSSIPIRVYQGTLQDGTSLHVGCAPPAQPSRAVAVTTTPTTGDCRVGYGFRNMLYCPPDYIDVVTAALDVIGFYRDSDGTRRAFMQRGLLADAITVDFFHPTFSAAASSMHVALPSGWSSTQITYSTPTSFSQVQADRTADGYEYVVMPAASSEPATFTASPSPRAERRGRR